MTSAPLVLPSPIRHAQMQAAVVEGAELGNHVLFKTLPIAFRKGLSRSSRTKRRLFDLLVSKFGEPAFSTPEVRLFHCMSDDKIVEAAFCIGLSYEISTLGSALSRQALERLTHSCSEKVVSNALKYADCLQTGVVKGQPRQPTAESEVLEANGWSLLKMWACANGINPDWRIAIHRTEKTNLGVVYRDNACILVQAVLADIAMQLGPC